MRTRKLLLGLALLVNVPLCQASNLMLFDYLLTDKTVDVRLMNGQSNANLYFYNAMLDSATDSGVPFIASHFNRGGNQLLHWMGADGVPGKWWDVMLNTYFEDIDAAIADGKTLGKFHMIYFQGESDVANSETQYALDNGTESAFVPKLTHFIEQFTATIISRYNVTPTISVALVAFDQSHPIFLSVDNLTSASVGLIRSEIQQVANSFDNVCTFETSGAERRDHVHIEYYPSESLDMKDLTDSAISCL